MSWILTNPHMPKELKKSLRQLQGEIIEVHPNGNLPLPLSGHPDLLVHPLPNGDVVVDRDHYSYYRERLTDRQVFPSKERLGGKYPKDIPLNGFSIGKYFVHHLDYTDPQILDYYSSSNYEMVSVKQGYSRCNVLLGSRYLMTSDPSIYNEMKERLDCYQIHHKFIELPGYEYGFIGGCSGRINHQLVLTGNPRYHPSGKLIEEVLMKEEGEILYLWDQPLYDVGSIFYLR